MIIGARARAFTLTIRSLDRRDEVRKTKKVHAGCEAQNMRTRARLLMAGELVFMTMSDRRRAVAARRHDNMSDFLRHIRRLKTKSNTKHFLAIDEDDDNQRERQQESFASKRARASSTNFTRTRQAKRRRLVWRRG